MPQKTDLNVFPYYDDFNADDNYHKVLFKPGYPVQARELTTLQSILQNQIEQFGTHTFKEGAAVIGGELSYKDNLNAVILENDYLGIPVQDYLPSLVGKVIRGQSSGIRAKINSYINSQYSVIGSTTIYVTYLNSDSSTNSIKTFFDGEILILEDSSINPDEIEPSKYTFQDGQAILQTISLNCIGTGTGVYLKRGIFFIRGYFIQVNDDFIYLDQYTNKSNYKVGFRIFEEFVNSFEDESLNDNAQGFSNYAAPGSDRFKISVNLYKLPLDSLDVENFILLKEIRNGLDISVKNTTDYNILAQEFARRTFDESGDYYTISPTITVKNTLNDLKGNEGLFEEGILTYNNNTPSDDLGSYVISPIKAYVRGFEVNNNNPTFLDFKKPRTTKTLENQSINYFTGPTFSLNRVYGSPVLGLSTSYTVSLRDSRTNTVGIATGKEIGLARVYDFALESGSYDISNLNANQWDISLYDIQTYTEINLNENLDNNILYNVPCQIKGKSSGAIAFLRYDARNSGIITAYNTQGTFTIGEKLIFNGIENSRVTTNILSYSVNDVKSLYGIDGNSYAFTGDVKQNQSKLIGQVNISGRSAGISTVTSSSNIFTGIVSPGNLVSFSNPGLNLITYAKVESVSNYSLTISGITTVTGVCDGALPSSNINPSDFKILKSQLKNSLDNTLYTLLPKRNVSSVDLSNSNLIIRKQFNVTITSNSTGTITAGSNETFLPYDEERYVLIRENGTIEPLSEDKFVFSEGGKQIEINGLTSGNGNARLIATITKINVKSKIKIRNKVKSLVIDKSKYSSSGIGVTTLNDGLLYGNYPYGVRVQDEEICLLAPDVIKVHGIFESNDINSPDTPSLTLTSITSPSNKTNDLLLGEEIVGKSSKAVAIYSERINDLKIGFVYLNSSSFIEGEEVEFKNSKIKAIITSLDSGDFNITSNFIFENGQKSTIYDFSKIIRKKNVKEPSRKIKIIFEQASFLESDSGDITTASSYAQFDYCNVPTFSGIKNTDIIDVRPRVSSPTISSGSRSPFEFLGRQFNQYSNSSSIILASDESSLINYSYYLPRIDKIFLSKDGIFQLVNGQPSENPQPPQVVQDSLELATIYLPAYLCDLKKISIDVKNHKRYRMSDIQKLEDRIKNLEYYTTLSLLETDTSNLQIKDGNGFDRFKSGFFVDDFSTTINQKKDTIPKNSIDITNSELRPTHYTTALDLILGSNSLIGIGTTSNPSIDMRFANDLIGSGVKRSGQIITLDYEETAAITQQYSTRVVNVTPYAIDYYGGTIELFPSSDVWVDQVRMEPKTVNAEGNYLETESQLVAEGFDPQTGYGPVTWNSWETTWTGESVSTSTQRNTRSNNIYDDVIQTTTKTGTSTRQGTGQVLKEQFDNTSFGDQILSSQIIPYVRSRNIEFTAKRLKPTTRVYAFFDGVDVNQYIIPKLLEISMTNGVFEVGETVIGTFDNNNVGQTPTPSNPIIKLRVAKQNHKYGEYNNPTDTFDINPYNITETIPEIYSSTSTILNIDTYSLSNQPQGNYYGYVSQNMKLRGEISKAEAVVTNIRLVTDNNGTLIGCFYIPDPNIDVNPAFECGSKIFRISSSSTNSQIIGIPITSAEEKYYAEGKINTVQENIIVVRNSRVESQNQIESKNVTEVGNGVVISSTLVGTVPQPSYSGGSSGGSSSSSGYNGYAQGTYQQAGTVAETGAVREQAQCGQACLDRALADGYSQSEVQAWVKSTGAKSNWAYN